MKRRFKNLQLYAQLAITLAIILVVNIISNQWYTSFDLTEDRRFTYTQSTYRILDKFNQLRDIDNQVQIEVYLEGTLPSDYRHLQTAVLELLDEFRSRNSMIEYRFTHPIPAGTSRAGKDSIEAQLNIFSFPVQESQHTSSIHYVYPVAKVRFGKQIETVYLLDRSDIRQNQVTKALELIDINEVVSRLEYRFANALRKISRPKRPKIAILQGHGEEPLYAGMDERGRLRPNYYVYDFQKMLFQNKRYTYTPLNLDSSFKVDHRFDLLIVPKPRRSFGDIQMFMIDQYVMNGGKVLWLVDGTNAETDSLRRMGRHVPRGRGLDIFEMIQNYGVRINENIVLSYNCGGISLDAGSMRAYTHQRWWYFPIAKNYASRAEKVATGKVAIDHPIVKGLGDVVLHYASSLDTMQTMAPIKKTVLLRTSEYSKLKYPPIAEVSFGEIDPRITQKAFRKGNQDVAVLLEGSFYSNYRNRVHPDMKRIWAERGHAILEASQPTKMIVISDGDLIRNKLRRDQRGMVITNSRNEPVAAALGEEWHPLYGLGHTYSNSNFLFNCIEYLLDDEGIMESRSRNVELRPLKQEKAYKEKEFWQALNLVFPAVLILLLAVVYQGIRRYRYER